MPILSVESRLVHFLEFLFELIVLNLLTLLCCIPIITAGAALTALYHSLFELRKGNGNIIKGFLKAFVTNFRPGLVLGLILLICLFSFSLYVFLFKDMIANGDVLVFVGLVFVATIFFFPMTFTFPLLASFDSPALRTLSNAFLLSFRHFGTSLVVLLINSLPWLLVIISPTWFIRILPLYVVFGLSLPGWFSSSLLLRVFRQYSDV